MELDPLLLLSSPLSCPSLSIISELNLKEELFLRRGSSSESSSGGLALSAQKIHCRPFFLLVSGLGTFLFAVQWALATLNMIFILACMYDTFTYKK